jgi:hypothetical protein
VVYQEIILDIPKSAEDFSASGSAKLLILMWSDREADHAQAQGFRSLGY